MRFLQNVVFVCELPTWYKCQIYMYNLAQRNLMANKMILYSKSRALVLSSEEEKNKSI